MKDDTISRAAALDALGKVAEMFQYRIPGNAKTYRQYNEAWSDAIDAAENALEALPSAQPGWIPCTPETMPEKTDTYLVQVGINKNGEGMHTEVRTAVWNVIWQKWYVHTTHCFVGDIIKWMPIPWEGGQDG